MTLAEVLGKHGIDTASLTDTTVAGGTETFALLAIQGSAVVGHWQRLRDLVGETSHWPVLLGDETFTFQLLGDLEDAEFSPSENIAAGLNLDVLDWIEQGYAKAPAWSIDLWHSRDNEEGSPTGDSANPDLLYAPTGTNYIALLPTTQSWQCPAWLLGFGGYNDCPDPEVHVAILKYWQARHGAEVLQILSDSVLLRVPYPIAERESARKLAREQLVYCFDIEEAATIAGLADLLMRNTIWRFWWD